MQDVRQGILLNVNKTEYPNPQNKGNLGEFNSPTCNTYCTPFVEIQQYHLARTSRDNELVRKCVVALRALILRTQCPLASRSTRVQYVVRAEVSVMFQSCFSHILSFVTTISPVFELNHNSHPDKDDKDLCVGFHYAIYLLDSIL